MTSRRNSSRRLSDEAHLLRSFGFSLLEIAKTLYPEDAGKLERARGEERRRIKHRLKQRVLKLLKNNRSRAPPSGDDLDNVLDEAGGERNPLSHRHVFHVERDFFIEKKKGLRGKDRVFYEYEQFLRRFWELFLKKYDAAELYWLTMRFLHEKSFDHVYGEFEVNYWGGKKIPEFLKAYAYVLAYFTLIIHKRYDLVNQVKIEVRDFYRISDDMIRNVYSSVFEVVAKIFII